MSCTDPTLQLPDHLLSSIFCYLNFRDLVHVRLVSKRWHRNTPSYCAFNFDESLFFENTRLVGPLPTQEAHNKFSDSILDSLETSKSRLIKAEKRIVHVKFDYICTSTCLTVFHLTRCALNEQIFNGEGKFDSLQEVKLDGVRLSGEALAKFISKCPNIRELSLVNCEREWGCYGKPMFIVLPKLDSLKKLYVKHTSGNNSISKVEVIAPSLQVFHFLCSDVCKDAVYMDIRACRMLREFHLNCVRFLYWS
ncbi:hypothetical protein A4A49_54172 [Nicotiana attenuata]|uniref:F-box domain-containing protein n=1 Tax=Nicotiana attenuata TaxID=49451 RepID=A0A1J6KAH0_NICAT|nr:hypothetical protein A4A49_54172 [Nicotiana attenuata]